LSDKEVRLANWPGAPHSALLARRCGVRDYRFSRKIAVSGKCEGASDRGGGSQTCNEGRFLRTGPHLLGIMTIER